MTSLSAERRFPAAANAQHQVPAQVCDEQSCRKRSKANHPPTGLTWSTQNEVKAMGDEPRECAELCLTESHRVQLPQVFLRESERLRIPDHMNCGYDFQRVITHPILDARVVVLRRTTGPGGLRGGSGSARTEGRNPGAQVSGPSLLHIHSGKQLKFRQVILERGSRQVLGGNRHYEAGRRYCCRLVTGWQRRSPRCRPARV